MKKTRFFALALAASLCLASLTGYGPSDVLAAEVGGNDNEEVTSYWDTQQYATDLTGSDFVKVGESGNLQLLLDPSTGTVRWMDTSTGAYRDTNLSHDENLASHSNNMQSDLIVRYFNGSKNGDKIYSITAVYDSYSMSSSRGQLAYQHLDNGVRIVYTLGDDSVTYKNFPTKISDERMEEYIGQYLDDTQRLTLERQYTQLSAGYWMRNFGGGENGAQNQLSNQGIRSMYEIFYEIGHYTDDLLMEDLEYWEAPEDMYPSNLEIKIPVEYYLDGDSLVVNVDAAHIETAADKPINQIQLLPYFLTSDTSGEAEDGYMFVPDGSGALIYLDSTKTREYHYQGAYYDGDHLVDASAYSDVDTKLQLPVYGMKGEDSTVFAVIENGAEVATLDAYISGTDNSEPFCKMGLTFDIMAQQRIDSGATNMGGTYYFYKASSDVYDEDITVRYYWLGKGATYVDMAKCYSEYLENKGILTRKQKEADPPFFVEFLGTTDKTLYFLGIPYVGTQDLTTFSQAKEMLEHMTSVGVKNVKLIYSGIVNGGINQRSLAGGVKFSSGLGGSSGFKTLKSYADSIGTTIYPNLMLQTVYTKTKLNNSTVAWNAINQRAEIYKFNPIDHSVDTDNDYPRFIISPTALDSYLNKAKSSYTKTLGLTNIASEDLYTFIPTNYRNTQVSPSTGAAILEESTKSFADGMSLMLSNPVADAYAYADYIMDVPVTNSGMRVLDASVPFMGMVLDGHLHYSAESSNRESTDVFLNIMHAIESNAQPKFTIMYQNSSLLTGTEQEHYFAVDYHYWKDQIGYFYNVYREFYDAVGNATIVDHEIFDRNDKLRVVTYSNGVKAYFNYSDLEEVIDGVTVPAFMYTFK